MRLLGNNMFRFLLQVFSLLPMLLVRNSYGHAAISIYNRYPIIVILLCILLLYGVLSKSKYSVYCEIFSYLSLSFLVLFRIIIKMEGFITFNRHLYGAIEYIKLIIGLILFLILLIYYLKKFFSSLIRRN